MAKKNKIDLSVFPPDIAHFLEQSDNKREKTRIRLHDYCKDNQLHKFSSDVLAQIPLDAGWLKYDGYKDTPLHKACVSGALKDIPKSILLAIPMEQWLERKRPGGTNLTSVITCRHLHYMPPEILAKIPVDETGWLYGSRQNRNKPSISLLQKIAKNRGLNLLLRPEVFPVTRHNGLKDLDKLWYEIYNLEDGRYATPSLLKAYHEIRNNYVAVETIVNKRNRKTPKFDL